MVVGPGLGTLVGTLEPMPVCACWAHTVVGSGGPTVKIESDEKKLRKSVERGEWDSAAAGKRERTWYGRYAKATFRKDRRLKIRLSSKGRLIEV